MRLLAFLVSLLAVQPAHGETVIATRTIRAQTVLTEQDLATKPVRITGTFDDPAILVGLEARVPIYAGRPVMQNDVGPPAIIDRNQVVILVYVTSGLTITTEARALGRAGVGDRLRVLNIASRQTVEGEVRPDGSVLVQ